MNKHQDLCSDIDSELYGFLNQSSSTGATILEDMNESDNFDFHFPGDVEFELLPEIEKESRDECGINQEPSNGPA